MNTKLKHPLAVATFEGFIQALIAARKNGSISKDVLEAIVHTAAIGSREWLLGKKVLVADGQALSLDDLTETDDNFVKTVKLFGLGHPAEQEKQYNA